MSINHFTKTLSIYDFKHCYSVAAICLEFCKYLNLNQKEIHSNYIAGLYHDIGKSYIDISILNKPDKLTSEEFDVIKKHPIYSYKICKSMNVDDHICDIILNHHELYNGSGYPYGVSSDNIPFGARILTICDNFDAIISDRIYREGLSFEKTLTIMENESYKFDKVLLAKFFKFIKKQNILF